MRFVSYGSTDVGLKRKHNEDAYLCDDELGLWVVADGMGGHAAGEVASQESIDNIYGMVKRGLPSLRTSTRPTEESVALARRLLEGAVQSATYMVFGMAEMDSGKQGMGTTISAVMAVGGLVYVAQVGDSRVYRMRDGREVQLTEDHTLINWQLKQGLITLDEAARSRHKNVITRAVGNRDYVQVDTMALAAEVGDQYLICSDGLHGYLGEGELPAILALGRAAAVPTLIRLAKERGGKDNITAIVIEVLDNG